MQCLQHIAPDLVVSQNRGPQYKSKSTIILILGTPKTGSLNPKPRGPKVFSCRRRSPGQTSLHAERITMAMQHDGGQIMIWHIFIHYSILEYSILLHIIVYYSIL